MKLLMMKLAVVFFAVFMLFQGAQVQAADIELVPTMKSESTGLS